MKTAEETAACEHSLGLSERYVNVRQFTQAICQPLSAEDCIVQSMPDASPIRWHLAHTTWFFETFLLKSLPDYRPYHHDFEFLFNSYYNAVGEQFPRHQRGLITRPSVDEVWDYRRHVDTQVMGLLGDSATLPDDFETILEIGLQHEQQHQELMLTDIKHALSCNPLLPSYTATAVAPETDRPPTEDSPPNSVGWLEFSEGVYDFGHSANDSGFAFDNESPRHRAYLHDYKLADRLVTSEEYLAFMDDGGYRRPELWLSLGWAAVQEHQWQAPLYWQHNEGDWHEFTMSGARPLDKSAPVCHVSYFEADAFARWSNKRLPTEFEWELASQDSPIVGNFAGPCIEQQFIHPRGLACSANAGYARQMFGDTWEWTASQYSPYPGFKPAAGAIGEYNGKFMCNQFVLRGGSCATSQSHIRRTYRNFFPPSTRWQFTGIRLAD